LNKLSFDKSTVEFENIENPLDVDILEIAFCNLTTLRGIERLARVSTIRIHYCRSLFDIAEISKLIQLKAITFYGTPQLLDYAPLEGVFSIEAIELNGSYKVASIRPFAKLPNLEYLALSRVKVVDGDYQPIILNKTLKRVFWHGGPFAPPALSEIKRLRPDILIGGNGVHNVNRIVKQQ
jgi:hypothetical protein